MLECPYVAGGSDASFRHVSSLVTVRKRPNVAASISQLLFRALVTACRNPENQHATQRNRFKGVWSSTVTAVPMIQRMMPELLCTLRAANTLVPWPGPALMEKHIPHPQQHRHTFQALVHILSLVVQRFYSATRATNCQAVGRTEKHEIVKINKKQKHV